ncbi:glucokinase [Bradyrhizobium oligotrophicum S58]|uniref:Glucokinase n=1 Tax=Bradyrhizobium oligotrophicum S58 TaxID=1245469 RepID=M4ZDN7_9BRAD|nr:glucokinase [Bradyrhizobium oligotrophicum]BAM91938.1 glucokinase [Bradyrhizobium oligotrophicum S58]
MSDRVLLGDIGGTNARFALLADGTIGDVAHLKVADFPTVTDAITDFLSRHAAGGPPTAAVLDIAGPIERNRGMLTNSTWVIDGEELAARFKLRSAKLLNDFEAVGWSLPALHPDDLFPLGGSTAVAGAPMLVIGPGTGFGAACYLPGDGRPTVAVTEAGHATLPATTAREAAVLAKMRERFGHVSIERALSGMGIENVYHAIAAVDGATVPQRDAAAITHAALDGSCATSRATLDMFCAWLGAVAGNLALTFCARGGVYIAGGIPPRFPDYFAKSDFRRQFESKGRYDSYLRPIPVHLVTKPDISFLGLKSFFEAGITASSGSPAH